MTVTPIQGLLAVGAVLLAGILWYGYATHGERATPLARVAVAPAPDVGHPMARAALSGGDAPPVLPDPTKFEGAYRAGKSLEGALAVGVSYKDFEGLLRAFAGELLVAKDRVSTPPEQALLEGYTEVLTTYQDSRVLWKEQADQALKYGWANAPERNPEGLIVVEGDVVRIVQRYGLPTRQGPDAAVIPGASIQFLWAKAATQFATASAAASIR